MITVKQEKLFSVCKGMERPSKIKFKNFNDHKQSQFPFLTTIF